MRGYVSARLRVRLFQTLLAGLVTLLALLLGASLLAGTVRGVAVWSWLEREFWDIRVLLFWWFYVVFLLFVIWAVRVDANAKALGLAPGFAWTVPVVATILPFVSVPMLARKVWLGSDPTPPLRWEVRLTFWLWSASLLLGWLYCFKEPERATDLVIQHDCLLIAALLLWRIVDRVQSRQDEYVLDLERRAAVPQPTADALR
jgi:hypothetical protein